MSELSDLDFRRGWVALLGVGGLCEILNTPLFETE